MRIEKLLFLYYQDRYGEYQARRLVSMERSERRRYVKRLERILTSKTDIAQPLWPELDQTKLLELREEAVRSITVKVRHVSWLADYRRKIAERPDQVQERHLDLLRELEELADLSTRAVEDLKQVIMVFEARQRRVRIANAILLAHPKDRPEVARKLREEMSCRTKGGIRVQA